MTSVAVRLTRLEAKISRPKAAPVYHLNRLTADQLERRAELLRRVEEVGVEGLIYEEVDELIEIEEMLWASEPPSESR